MPSLFAPAFAEPIVWICCSPCTPMARFTKNLTVDQVKLSFLKGEGELPSLELDEVTLMRLLDLPTWLYLRQAHCSHVSLKIRWTKLESLPITLVIDRVDLDIEVLNEPRMEDETSIASYKTKSGKYGFTDRVIDGVSILINTVFIRFTAQAFSASVELSRLQVVSKTPKWQDGPLNLTSLTFPAGDAVLVFKQLSWDSARILADGLLAELNGIPLKLITNSGKLRLTLKKRISDSVVIGSRIRFMLDDLLWVLTLYQVQAAVVFVRSLQRVVALSVEQRKQFVASRAMRQTMSWRSVVAEQTGGSQTAANARPQSYRIGGDGHIRDEYSQAARIFHHYDVLETSYHLCVSRAELHFCDEAKADCQLSYTIAPNGSVRLNLVNLEVDWYPYHVDISPQRRWKGCREFLEAHSAWLESIHCPTKQHSATTPTTNPSLLLKTSSVQSVGVLRISDFRLPSVSFPNTSQEDVFASKLSARRLMSQVDLELPGKRNKNAFVGTDSRLHCLPPDTNFLTLEVRSPYLQSSGRPSSAPEPMTLFAKVNPFYVNFDGDTVIWMTAFFLTLQMNLWALIPHQKGDVGADGSKETPTGPPMLCHLRLEVLMPRVILPLPSFCGAEPPKTDSSSKVTCPDALVIQADQLIVQLLLPPVADATCVALNRAIIRQRATHVEPVPCGDRPHPPVGLSSWETLLHSGSLRIRPETFDQAFFQYWCIYCPNLWANFLTVSDVGDDDSSASGRPPLVVHLSSLLESIPLTLWARVSLRADHLVHPWVDVIADLDAEHNPLASNSSATDYYSWSTKALKPIVVKLGDVDRGHARACWSYGTRICESVDQLVFTSFLVNRLSGVWEQLTLDVARLTREAGRPISSQGTEDDWLYSLTTLLTRPVWLCLPDTDCGEEPVATTASGDRDCAESVSRTSDCQSGRPASPSATTPLCPAAVGQEEPVWTPPRRPVSRMSSVSSLARPEAQPGPFFFGAHTAGRQNSPQLRAGGGFDSLPTRSSAGSSDIHSGFPARNSSFDSMSLADDSSDAISLPASQDDWLKTFTHLAPSDIGSFDFDDTSSVFDEIFASTPPALLVDEVGTEALEMISNGSQQCLYEYADHLVQCDAKCKTVTKSSIIASPDVVIQLLGLSVDADSTSEQSRLWVNLGPVVVIKTASVGDSLLGQVAELSPLKPTWRLYMCARSITTGGEQSNSQLPTTSMSLSVSLCADYALFLPDSLVSTLSLMKRRFTKWGGCDQLSFSMAALNQNSRYTSPPPPYLECMLSLDGGSLQVEWGSPPPATAENAEAGANLAIRKICLKRGLFIRLDESVLVTLGYRRTTSKEHSTQDSTGAQRKPNGLLEDCQKEIVRLRQEIQRVTLELEALKSGAACQQNRLS